MSGVEADEIRQQVPTRRVRSAALDRTRIVDAALRLIDTHGLQALNMRRLGAALGVEGMALYRYVPSRDNLLDAVVERVIDELYSDPDVHLLPHDGWPDYLTRLARGVRRIALDHPEAFPLIATRPPVAPWLRPPLRSLRWVDSFFEGLKSRGFTDDHAVATYRAFSSFLLGHLLLEVAALGVTTGPVEEVNPDQGPSPEIGLADYPHVRGLVPQLSEDRSGQEFDDSLYSLIDRIGTRYGPQV